LAADRQTDRRKWAKPTKNDRMSGKTKQAIPADGKAEKWEAWEKDLSNCN
jgi:hypothetical protein